MTVMTEIVNSTTDFLRVGNLALIVLIVVAGILSRRHLLTASRASVMGVMAVGALLIFAWVATWESLWWHAPSPGIRTPVLTAALCWLLMALHMKRQDS